MIRFIFILFASFVCVAQQTRVPVNVGTSANDGTGDPVRNAFIKLNTNDYKLWRTVYTNAPINVKDYGAKGDGVTDDAAAFTSALASVSTRGVVLVPEGTYKLNSPLTINVTKVRMSGWNAKLDFSGLATNQTAITVTGTGGGAGTPYYQADGGLSGLQIQGPGPSGTSVGIYIHTAVEPGPSHIKIENCNLYDWGYGVKYGDNAYLTTFDNVDIHNCDVGVWLPAAIVNSGEAVRFIGGVIYNNVTYAIKQESINAFLKLIGTSIDYNGAGLYLDQGRADLLGAHFESDAQPHIIVPTNNPSGLAIISALGGLFYRDTDSTNAMIDLRGRVQFTAIGCEIHDYATTNAAKVKGSANSSVFLFGGRMIYNPVVSPLDLSGNNIVANWDYNGGILEAQGFYSKNEITAANNITATNQLVGGTVRSLSGGEFASTVYTSGLYVTNNLVVAGPSFINSTMQVTSNLTALASVAATGNVTSAANVEADARVVSKSGVFVNNNNTVTLTVTNTWYNLGTGSRSGLYVLRDQTSGGGTVVFCDTSAGPAYLTNAITGFEFRYDPATTNMQARVTSGTVPRNVRWVLLQATDE